MNETVPSRLPVFVCYAHIDNESPDPSKRWLDRLLEQLAPLAMQDQVCAWSDKDIETGQDWNDRIQQTLENTKAAVLLVSSAFLASTYIRNSELPVLLKNAKDRGVIILPVILRHCLFKETTFKYPDPANGPEELSLATLQSANPPSIPLNSMSEHEQDKVLLEVAQTLLAILHQSDPPQTSPGNFSKSIWNIPLERNPFFTGREDILGEIRAALLSSGRAAFSGLGGIGKSQTAVEYAYRNKEHYTHIFWVNAESNETLIAAYGQLASLLNLINPTKNYDQDQQKIVKDIILKDIKEWLQQNENWLLILDNADDLSLIYPFIQGLQSSHILLTTKSEATGTIFRVKVRKLPDEEGAVFLLLRAKITSRDTPFQKIPKEQRTQALALVQELDGLPLALDQAGAYIEETKCGLAGYLELYRTHGVDLLKERGLFDQGHPDPVATTWVLSFQKIEQANPAAVELLRFCACLHPDAIPEELITQGAPELGPILRSVAENGILFNQAIGEILKFSLIHRDEKTKTLAIHRLVQAVILKTLSNETHQQWVERLIRAMNRVFPEVKFEHWPKCDRLLAQAQQCASFISQQNLMLLEGALVLNKTAIYLQERNRYSEAEPLYQRALAIREPALGPTHPAVAISLNNLASLYWNQGKYPEAEPLLQRALAIKKEALGPTHSDVAMSMNNLGELYRAQGKYPEAKSLLQRALAIREQVLGPAHLDVATSLNNLALLYCIQGKYAEAEPLYQRALRIKELALGPTHPDVANTLNNLGELYCAQGKYPEAEPLYQRALAIREPTLGPTHPAVAASFNSLASLYCAQGKYPEAEPLYQRALAIREEALGHTHPSVAVSLHSLARLYHTQKDYAKAEPLLQRALAIWEQVLGPAHPDVAKGLNDLAGLYHDQGKYIRAEPNYQRALAIREEGLGPSHPDVANSLNNLAGLYHDQGKFAEAEPLLQRALKISEERLGLEHPTTRKYRKNYEGLLKKMASEKG